MPYTIEDLTPFFRDRCWMFAIPARQASLAVILRRGPTEWWRVSLWDTLRDAIQPGQWFRGRIYPEKCDLSPNGKLFIYFVHKFSARSMAAGYTDSWTAVSRPPYLTALALWPIGSTYGGRGVFLDDRTVLVGSCSGRHHPDHPPGPLRLADACSLPSPATPSWDHLWRRAGKSEVRKPMGELILGREYPDGWLQPSRRRTLYTLYRADQTPLALFEAHWADWDRQGRLVATVGGRVLAGKLTRRGKLVWRELAALQEERPTRLETPDWARRW